MSALDDIAKKYAEEAMQLAPAAGIASAVVGVALHHCAVGTSAGSVWWRLLTQKYEEYWYFLDILKQQKMLWLAVPIVLACCGGVFFRIIAKKFLARGIASQAPALRDMFTSARLNAHWGSEKAVEIAESWYKRSERKVFVFFSSRRVFFWLISAVDGGCSDSPCAG